MSILKRVFDRSGCPDPERAQRGCPAGVWCASRPVCLAALKRERDARMARIAEDMREEAFGLEYPY
jgi:hypothetical protein